MIVKDEAQNLKRCLNSVAGCVDEIIIVDTGSTDGTREVAREFGALVRAFPWNENFSEARNASLELATGEWILYLDADEVLAEESREELRRLAKDDNVEGYFIKIVNYLGSEGWVETCPDLVFRFFRNRREYRFHGAIHEQIADVILENSKKANYKVAEEIVIIHYGYLDRQIEEKNKKSRNLKIIQKELEQESDNRLLRYHYGVELFRAKRYAEAAEEFIKAANGIDPKTIYLPKLLRYVVISYQSAGLPEKALDVARLGLQFFADYADLYYYSGVLCLELKQYVLAGEYFQKAVSMPEQPAQYASFSGVRGFRAFYNLGQISEIFLNYEEALRHYILCLRDNPDFTPALENIIRILEPRKNPEYTKECLEKIFEFCTPRSRLILGEIYFRQGAYALALECLEGAAENMLLSPEARLWKAICLIQERRYLEALRIIDTYTRESSFYPLAKLNELLCFWVQGKKRKVRSISLELYALGLASDTENVIALFLDTPDKHKKSYKVTLGTDGVSLLLEIIARLLYLTEIERAMKLLNKIEPDSFSGCRLKISRLFYDYGYMEKAEALLREHLTSNQEAEAHFLLGEIYQKNGNYVEAEQHYRYALEKEPDHPRYYICLIHLYENLRKEILLEAVEKYPDSEVFKQLLEEARNNL